MDNAKNFAKSTLASGITSGATSLTVATGEGTKFPAVSFNAVIFNSTDYADPADDPNVEIVRVTAISTDTLTITRAQESTTAVAHNTAGKTYSIIAGLTAKTINDDIGAASMLSWIPQPISMWGDSFNPNISQGNFLTETHLKMTLVHIPFAITVNKITVDVTAVNTNGELILTFYSEDGQTKIIEETTSTISGTGNHTHTLSAGVELSPGLYWMGTTPNGSANIGLKYFNANSNDDLFDGVSGKPVYNGYLTITDSTPPSTISLPISSAGQGSAVMRLDN